MQTKYNSYKEIPDLLTTQEGDILLIHGYLRQAQEEVRQEERDKMSVLLLNTAFSQAQQIADKEKLLDWLETVLRHHRPDRFKTV